MESDSNAKNSNSILRDILERQKKDLVVRFSSNTKKLRQIRNSIEFVKSRKMKQT